MPNSYYDFPGAVYYEDYLQLLDSHPDPAFQGFRLKEEITYGWWLNKILTNVMLP